MINWLKKIFQPEIKFTPIPTEHREKAWEYQQVAGLLCLDIDLLVNVCRSDMSKEEMLWQIKDLQEKKDEIIRNKDARESRYQAAYFLSNLKVN